MSAAIRPCLFKHLADIQNHAHPRERTNILLRPIQICYERSIVPVHNLFCLVLGSLCCWRCDSFISCKYIYACSPKKCPKCSCSMHVRKSKCSCGYLFPTKRRLLLKPENAIKSSESCKNCMAEYQARKTALESVDQSQVCIGLVLYVHAHKKPLKCQKNPRDASRPI